MNKVQTKLVTLIGNVRKPFLQADQAAAAIVSMIRKICFLG